MKKTILTFIILITSAANMVAADNKVSLLLSANNYYNRGLFVAAMRDYAKVLEIEPDNRTALEYTGYCYLAEADFEKGIEYLDRVYKMSYDPGVLEVLEQAIDRVKVFESKETIEHYRERVRKQWWLSDFAGNMNMQILHTDYMDISNPLDLYSDDYSAALVLREKKNKLTLTPGFPGRNVYNNGAAFFNKEGTKLYLWLTDDDAITVNGGVHRRENNSNGMYCGGIEYARKLAENFSLGMEIEYYYFERYYENTYWSSYHSHKIEKFEYMVSAVIRLADWIDVGVKAGRNNDENNYFANSPYVSEYIEIDPFYGMPYYYNNYLHGTFEKEYLFNGYSGITGDWDNDLDTALEMNGYNVSAGTELRLGKMDEISLNLDVFMLNDSVVNYVYKRITYGGALYTVEMDYRHFAGDGVIVGISYDALIKKITTLTEYGEYGVFKDGLEGTHSSMSAGVMFYGRDFRIPLFLRKEFNFSGDGYLPSKDFRAVFGFEAYIGKYVALRLGGDLVNGSRILKSSIGAGLKLDLDSIVVDAGITINEYGTWNNNSGLLVSVRYVFD